VKGSAVQGALQAPGQATTLGLGLLGRYGSQHLPSVLKQYWGIPEEITKYVQKRGTSEVLSPENLVEGAALSNVDTATAGLATARKETGKAIGAAEKAGIAAKGDVALPETKVIADELKQTLVDKGYLDPVTGVLAKGEDTTYLKKVLDVLSGKPPAKVAAVKGGVPSSVPGFEPPVPAEPPPFNLQRVMNAKKLIGSNIDWENRLNTQLTKPAVAILKKTDGALRELVRKEMGPEVGALYDKFGVIADAQEKLAEFTGTRELSRVEQSAVRRLQSIMTGNPKEVNAIVDVLGAGLPGGVKQARTIFDSIAATSFQKAGHGAPSNIVLKGATALGGLGAGSARLLARGQGAISRATEPALAGDMTRTLTVPRFLGPMGTAIMEYFNRRNQPSPALQGAIGAAGSPRYNK
jgi:hypothetical protein